jgi:plasmid stabilization system protein ParE
MTYTFVNRPEVKNDILDAINYYNSINPSLSKQLLVRLREAKKLIAIIPTGFQIRHKNVRTILLKQFPYHLHYLINEKENQIVILAFMHAYSNPKDFSSR